MRSEFENSHSCEGRHDVIATSVDDDQVQAFLRHTWPLEDRDNFGAEGPQLWETQTRAFYASCRDSLVGVATAKVMGGVGHLSDLIVRDDHRGVGLGSALLKAFEDFCWETGCHKLELKTIYGSSSHHFYLNRKWQEEGIHRNDVHGRDWVRLVKWKDTQQQETDQITVYLYDSFASRPFGGNVAGVVLDASTLSSETMQCIAAKLNAPTTGFVVGYEPGPPPTFAVRYFTPRQEIDLCGHVTVALFTALVMEGRCLVKPEGTQVCQRTSTGELPVLLYPGEGGRVTVEMEQRLPYFESPSIERTAVQEVLGNVPLHPSLPLEIASTGLRHLVVPFSQIGDLARLNPDFGALTQLSHTLKADTICAFALSPETKAQVRMRDFCSGIGADEEPASGTTSGALACYLAKHGVIFANQQGEVRVHVEQGVEMGRPSWIEVRLTQVEGAVQHVCVRGRAIEVLKGELFLQGD